MLNWAQQFNIFCFLDNGNYAAAPHTYDCLLGVGAAAYTQGGHADLKNIDAFIGGGHYVFGHLSYELLHPLYKIASTKKDAVGFPPFFFFKPQVVLYIQQQTLFIEAQNPAQVYAEIEAWGFEKVVPAQPVRVQPSLSKEAYIACIRQLQQHILRGDCYEINFCQAFHAHGVTLHPLQLFQNLMQASPAPFAAFYKLEDRYLICASPERFLAKQGTKLIAQPIKGTAARSTDAALDAALKQTLHSAKEEAENVMIVDLMRNDLSKICSRGSVTVDELFGVYSFPQVHQLISTISGTIENEVLFSEILNAAFPMGSMTGAPKQRVMELIEQYEPTARGLFSGSVGYIAPGGDFDFNVVIRSMLYNTATDFLQYQVGSGITFYSDAEKEWEECLLKAAAIKNVLSS